MSNEKFSGTGNNPQLESLSTANEYLHARNENQINEINRLKAQNTNLELSLQKKDKQIEELKNLTNGIENNINDLIEKTFTTNLDKKKIIIINTKEAWILKIFLYIASIFVTIATIILSIESVRVVIKFIFN